METLGKGRTTTNLFPPQINVSTSRKVICSHQIQIFGNTINSSVPLADCNLPNVNGKTMTAAPKLIKSCLWNKIRDMHTSLPKTDKTLQKLLLRKNSSRFNNFEQAMQGFKRHANKIALKFVTHLSTISKRGSGEYSQ